MGSKFPQPPPSHRDENPPIPPPPPKPHETSGDYFAGTGIKPQEQVSVTVRNIDVVFTKVTISPGDVLVVGYPKPLAMRVRENVARCFRESFGVPAIVLSDGIKLEAVLTLTPEVLEMAADERQRSAERLAEAMKKVAGNLSREETSR